MGDELRTILLELKSRLQELYGGRLVEMVLYGSQARGDAVEGSDIDVLVVLRGDVDPVRRSLAQAGSFPASAFSTMS